MDESSTPPSHWDDLDPKQKAVVIKLGELDGEQLDALVSIAKGKVFWKEVWARISWLKGPAQILVVGAAAYTILTSALGEWLASIMGDRPNGPGN